MPKPTLTPAERDALYAAIDDAERLLVRDEGALSAGTDAQVQAVSRLRALRRARTKVALAAMNGRL